MTISNQFLQHFSIIRDPRKDTHNKRHKLMDIFVLTILAVICGADTWVDVELFGKSKEEWLKTFLELPNGIPSHDTIGDIFARLNPMHLQQCFMSWVQSLVKIESGEIIAIDGKTVRRSQDKVNGKNAIHMISAWANKSRVVLGQRKVDDKSNEITAVPELLKMIDVKNSVVTIDAMGCQRKIAEQIHQQGGDYVLAVKENQGKLEEAIAELFKEGQERKFDAMVYSTYETVEKDHGRIETRRYSALPMMYLHKFKLRWKGFKSVGMVESTREIKGEAKS
jgi:predicted transposase YbfD/YdcC